MCIYIGLFLISASRHSGRQDLSFRLRTAPLLPLGRKNALRDLFLIRLGKL